MRVVAGTWILDFVARAGVTIRSAGNPALCWVHDAACKLLWAAAFMKVVY